MSKTKTFFNDVISYSSATVLSNILNFITGIVIRRVLQPAFMGLFNEIMLVFDYARYSHIGVIDALDRELPYLYGKKDHERLEKLKNIGFAFCLLVTLSISIAIFIVSLFIKFNNDVILSNGIRIVCFMITLRLVSSLYVVLNRSRNRYSVITRYTVLTTALDVIFKIALVIKFGLYGLLWASVLTLIFGLIYFYKASHEKFKFILDFTSGGLLHLLKVGFPLFIMGFVGMTLMSVDRIMIIRFLGTEALGFYTIALMVSVYIVQLPNLVYAVFFPRFYQAYGEKQNIFEIKELFMKPTLIFAYFFPILVGMVIFYLPLLVGYVIPAYKPGLIPAYILLLGSSFIALVNMPGYLLIALNKQIYMVVIGIIGIVFGFGLNYLFAVKLNHGLLGIAAGMAITYFLYATMLIAFAYRHYTRRFSLHLKFFAELYTPFFWVLFLLIALHSFSLRISGDLLSDFFRSFYKSGIFLLGCIPLILYSNRKTGILTLLKDTYFKKR